MPGRKQPRTTESERDREYRMMQKRGYGESVVGERGMDLEGRGAAAEVEREREAWAEHRERLRDADI